MYEKTQYGWVIIISVLLALIYASYFIFYVKENKVGLMVFVGIMMIVFLSFYRLKITVDNTSLSFKMGIGFIQHEYLFEDINTCKPVRNKWWYGWGIRYITDGILYAVSGLDAVELSFRYKHRRIRIGTDEPEELTQIITDRLKAKP